MAGTLRVILGDQLTHELPIIKDANKENDVFLMAEVASEATYVKHHKKKIAFIFSAMRHFAEQLIRSGYRVFYTKITDANNGGSILAQVQNALIDFDINSVAITAPGEYRLLTECQTWSQTLSVDVEILEDVRFLATPSEFAVWANGKKQLRMEYFYREMRKKHNILLDDGKPVGGKWNYDAANRKKFDHSATIPAPTTFPQDTITKQVITEVTELFAHHFGDIQPFHFAVTHTDAQKVLAEFVELRLAHFGDFQDAMVQNEDWMFHSHLSFYLNCGLLTPAQVIDAAEHAYHLGSAPLNAVEGFIRQVLGWREYVRGLYWLMMPEYKKRNFLNADRQLPNMFWTADTDMNCLQQCIKTTKENAYAHHIQRLMVLGNFALLTGLHPEQVNNWYLIVYADAYEWVELPNVTGMVLFADGGVLASKPYAASGAYIHKMSNYCEHCHYNVKEKQGTQACPFNYLYWHFLIQNQYKLQTNPRLAMPYRTLNKMDAHKQNIIVQDANAFLEKLDNNEKV